MKVYLSKRDEGIMVQARAETGKVDGPIGDMFQLVKPGADFYGMDYDDLEKLGDGEQDIPDDDLYFSETPEDVTADILGGLYGDAALKVISA
jgi:hypothetical protein